ncbi:MAG: tRNA lysidine(34) synthetase TilS [Clostridia bacterium]|nr:tRNA lysidine(34) synthetase TilS [Clostridia bacterium]
MSLHPLWKLQAPWELAGFDAHTSVLLALSGGADSRALLHVLSEQAKRDGNTLVLAHVQHGIRGEEALRDAVFCEALADQYGCELLRLDADVPALARQNGRSLELEAREVRYAFFERIMRERQIPLLVTAHHGDDHLETVLFRMCRGTGLHGLCGIPTVRAFGDGFLVRPLLPYSRDEILEFCRQEGLEYVTDSSNEKGECSRNRIRLDVTPALKRHFSDVTKQIYRMSQTLAEDQAYLCEAAERFLEENRCGCGVSADALRNEHPSIRRRAIAMLSPKTLEAVHLTAAEELLERGRSGSSVSVSGNLCVCLQNGVLFVLPDLRRAEPFEEFPLCEGDVSLCDGTLTVSVKKYEKTKSNANIHKMYTSSCIIIKGDSETVSRGLYFRSRREGDTVIRNGVRRQLRRLWREAGVPNALRDALPLLCDQEGIYWTPFVGFRDGAEPPKNIDEIQHAYSVTVSVTCLERTL